MMDKCYFIIDNESSKVSYLTADKISELLGQAEKVWKKKVNSGTEFKTTDNRKVVVCCLIKEHSTSERLSNRCMIFGLFVYFGLVMIYLASDAAGIKVIQITALCSFIASIVVSFFSIKDE